MALFEIGSLGEDPGAAAAQFYGNCLPLIEVQLSAEPAPLTILFPQADYTHAAWRLAAVQTLARQFAPQRVNAVAGGSAGARVAAADYLSAAEGVTGQVLQLDDAGAGLVVEPV